MIGVLCYQHSLSHHFTDSPECSPGSPELSTASYSPSVSHHLFASFLIICPRCSRSHVLHKPVTAVPLNPVLASEPFTPSVQHWLSLATQAFQIALLLFKFVIVWSELFNGINKFLSKELIQVADYLIVVGFSIF